MKRLAAILLTIAMALGLAACSSNSNSGDSSSSAAAFSPRLDTSLTAAIEIAGFMGNFEALDQAMNAFSEIYPNVTFNYDYNSAFMLNEYMDNNLNVDIFMTNDQNIKRVEPPEYYVGDWCLDLSKEDINLSAVQPDVLSCCTVNGEPDCWPSRKVVSVTQMLAGISIGTRRWLNETFGMDL